MMDALFERHIEYLTNVPMAFERRLMEIIDWESRLVIIRGPKGVGKSTLMLQRILQQFGPDDRHVLYCSADTAYFATHTIIDIAADFVRRGGRYLFIDEIHKYEGWSREIKEVYDLYKSLHVVLSGSSLIRINDGQADLSRRADIYDMPGLSFREFIWFRTGIHLDPVSLGELTSSATSLCNEIRGQLRPLELFPDYLKNGYYPFSFEKRKTYKSIVEQVIVYITENELVRYRGVSVSNTRKLLSLIQILSATLPYLVDITKLSRSTGIDRVTLLKYLKYLDEAKIIRNLYTELDYISDLQKPDKILMDNTNVLYTFAAKEPDLGTVRETFFCNQIASAGHRIEYGGIKTGDFRIDGDIVIEVGGPGKDWSQINTTDRNHSALALDNIDVAVGKRIPLWLFGFLY